MHRTKCKAVTTSVLAPHLREELKEDVGESPYSLYLDKQQILYPLTSSSAYLRSTDHRNTTSLSVLTWGLLIF